jgi:hypothetical protein
MTIPNAISIMEQEAVRAVKISRDQDLPKLTRSEYARLGQRLKELAVLEAALAKKTSAMFTTLVDSWSSALRKGNE